MDKKKSSGRRKLEIKPIVVESKRHVAFSKRKAGIFNKAAELNVLTGAEVMVIIFSKCGKAYTFATPESGPVVSAWLGERAVAAAGSISRRSADEEFASAKRELRRLEDSARRLAEQRKGGGFWWDRPVEWSGAGVEELKDFHESLMELRRQVAERSALVAVRGDQSSSSGAVSGKFAGSPTSEVYN